MLRTRLATVVIGLAAVALTGCGDATVADRVYGGLPENLDDVLGYEEVRAVWLEDTDRFAVVTWGSSSCPAVATELTVEAADELALMFGQPKNGPCTADMAATTHEFVTPEELTGRPVHLTVSFEDWDATVALTLE